MDVVEESSHKRPGTIRFHLCDMSRRSKSIEIETRFMVARARGRVGLGDDC